jgi:hypothetical protein
MFFASLPPVWAVGLLVSVSIEAFRIIDASGVCHVCSIEK